MELIALPDNPSMLNERNGGNVFDIGAETYRVLQDCSTRYGERILLRRIDSSDFENGLAADTPAVDVSPSDLRLDKMRLVATSCHTYNRSEHIEVVDIKAERFVWFGPISSMHNKYLYESQKSGLPV